MRSILACAMVTVALAGAAWHAPPAASQANSKPDVRSTAEGVRQQGLALQRQGRLYLDDPGPGRADNVEKAIAAYSQALKLLTREAFPQEWASTQNSLGAAYQYRIRGDRAENLEDAIKHYQAALTVRTREAFPLEWALVNVSLAGAYNHRVRGDRAENQEQAIKAAVAALTVLTREGEPYYWRVAQNNLATAYHSRIRGNRADNLELAIRALEAAVHTTDWAVPQFWLVAQINLASAYLDRIRGDKAANLEDSIKLYEKALGIAKRETQPELWARIHNDLGFVYRNRIRGDKADNLEHSIKHFEAALTVSTREAFPLQWARTQSDLAASYRDRISGDRAENLEQAIKAVEAALTVLTREALPYEWASTQTIVATVYRERIRGNRAENLEQAIKAVEAALTVRTLEALPREYLKTSRLYGQVLLEKRDWAAAVSAYADARRAYLLLFGHGLDEDEARELIEQTGPLFGEAAYALAETGDRVAALGLLSEGKARLMAVALQQQSLNLPAQKRVRHAALKEEIREASRIVGRSLGVEGTEVQRLATLRRELLTLVESAIAEDGQTGTAMVLARAGLPQGGAIVAPIITGVGGKFLIVTAAKDGPIVTVLDVPELTTERLDRLVRGDGGWISAYNIQYLPSQKRNARINEWLDAIDAIGPQLWALFAGRLDGTLKEHRIGQGARLVWLPTSGLGLLPLGLAQEPKTNRRLGDTYEIVTAPSLEALRVVARGLLQEHSASLAAAVNPTGDLVFTEIESALVATHFPAKAQIRLDKSKATPRAVLAALKGKSYWHFSTHGVFDWNNPRRTGLLMKDGEPLTVGQLLMTESSLGRPRLVVLSACETGLYDINRSPDEFVGLPSTFMQLGATGVLGTLWNVDDLATALLMARFYELHLGQRLAPSAALKGAQVWLRAATRADLIAYVKAAAAKAKLYPASTAKLEASLNMRYRLNDDSRFAALWNIVQQRTSAGSVKGTGDPPADDADPLARPFAHPYYWGGFIYTGL